MTSMTIFSVVTGKSCIDKPAKHSELKLYSLNAGEGIIKESKAVF